MSLVLLILLPACSDTMISPEDPWKSKDFRRPAEGAPNQLSKSSLSDPDMFYARSEYTVRPIDGASKQTQPADDGRDRSNIPYQRFKQTLQDFSRQQQDSGQKALEEQKKKQAFLGAKLPDDPGTVPSLPADDNLTRNEKRDFLQTIRNLDTPQPRATIKAALLVPLSGEHQHIGQAMLKAAETAMFNLGAQDYEILPRDTKGTPQGARAAFNSAVQDGADVVMGPLFASSAQAIKPLARRNDIKVFAFTTDWTVADDNTYIMGFLPFSQVQKIVSHAAATGMQRIGVFAPDNAYGRAVVKAYQSSALEYGLETVKIVRYPTTSSNISPIIREFTDYDARVEELNQLIRPLKTELEKSPNNEELKAQIKELESQDTGGEPPYDAVLMPIGGEQAKAVANLLSFYDLDADEVTRLGTGLWDDPALATEPNMEGGRFAASSPDARKSFENQYRRLYGVTPPRLSTLAYDATALTVVLGRNRLVQGYSDTELFRDNDITNPNGFAGVDGIFRFRPDGLIERGLAILAFENRDIVILEPAPSTFQRQRF